MAGAHIQPLEAADWRDAAGALALAFEGDPVMRWLISDAGRRPQALERYFAVETHHVVLPHRESLAVRGADGAVEGVLLVVPPERWRVPLSVQARQAPQYARVFGRRLGHALGVLSAMERRHLREPHLYVPNVGVVPGAQGRGLGAQLMAPLLERARRERLPVYLEASNPGSARLYERLGFRGSEEIRPLGAPPLRLMRFG